LIEVGAGTDPLDMMDSPRTRGDFVFVVPYMMEPDPTEDTLRFRTSIAFADVYFLFDISGSMRGEINNLRTAVTTIANDLQCTDTGVACMRDTECADGNICSPFTMTCVEDPGTSSCILSPYTGAGFYEECLWHGRGSCGGYNPANVGVALQSDPAVTAATMARWDTFGGDERLYRAIQAVAEGGSSGLGCEAAMPGFVGCPGYRAEAVKILVAFTDEGNDVHPGISLDTTATALRDAGISLIGVWSRGSTSERVDLANIVRESGSLSGMGDPLIFDASSTGTGIEMVVTNAINEIVEGVPLRVTIASADDPSDAVDALQFIDRLATNTMAEGCSMLTTEDSDMDGVEDAFPAVTPGRPVCWDVIPAMNTMVEPTLEPQVYRATLTVSGDGSPLDERQVIFLIPPDIPDPGMVE